MLPLERAAARMVCIGFHGTSVPAEVDALLARGVGGVVFFARNVESPQQFAGLCAELKGRAAGRPLLTSIDQEGGRVQRLREPFTLVPPMRAVGQAGDERLAYDVGRVLGRELRAVGVDLNLAPVLDVDTNPANPVIGPRSFGRTPRLVAAMGCALLRGLQDEHVAACGKHFPGHGDTSQDSHHALPVLDHPPERLESVELVPFRAAVDAGVAAIMSAHVVFRPVDPDHPATLSRPVLQGILRQKLGFGGPIVSDAMEMKAIADHYGLEDAVVRAAAAGVDLLMVCHAAADQHRAIEALVKAVERGTLSRDRLDDAARRLDALCARYVRDARPGPLPDVIGCPEHQAVVDRVKALCDAASLAVGHDPTEPPPA